MVRVAIADDEPLVRAGIKLVLSAASDIEVVAEAGDGREAVDVVARHTVDVLLLDIRMPGMDGLTAIAEVAKVAPATKVAFLTTFGEAEYIGKALERGAAGFLLKDSAPDELVRAVRVLAAGESYLSPSVTTWVMKQVGSAAPSKAVSARVRLEALTERETDVLRLLAQGLSNADISTRLHASEATVKMYVSRVLAKLNCTNRVQAAIIAHDAGMEQ